MRKIVSRSPSSSSRENDKIVKKTKTENKLAFNRDICSKMTLF